MLLATVVGLGLVAGTASPADTEKKIAELVTRFNDAYRANDLEAYFDYYAPDVTLWFESGRETLAGYQGDWEKLIAGGGGVEKNDVSDLRIQIGPDGSTAVATYRVQVVTRQSDGTRLREEAMETDVWFKRDGKWKVVHLHYNSKRLP
jgi:uncharacterized protein (TIGR02246 family)